MGPDRAKLLGCLNLNFLESWTSFMWGLVESFSYFRKPSFEARTVSHDRARLITAEMKQNASTWDATHCLPPPSQTLCQHSSTKATEKKRKKKEKWTPAVSLVTPECTHTHTHKPKHTRKQGKKSDANFQTANSTEDGHKETTPHPFLWSFSSLMIPEFNLKSSSLSVMTLAYLRSCPC